MQLQTEIDQSNDNLKNMSQETQTLSTENIQAKIEKLVNIFKISMLQGKARKFEELINGNAKLSYPEQQLRQ